MKWTLLAAAACAVGCVNAPPIESPSAPAEFRSASEEQVEARALEQAETECATQEKHAEAHRIEGETVFTCVD
jgi:hypothetical protein